MKVKQKGFLHIFLLLTIALVTFAGIGYFAHKYKQLKVPSWDNLVKNENTERTNIDSIKDWLSYESTLFSFNYPRELEIGSTRNSIFIFDGPTEEKNSDYYFSFYKPDEFTQVGPITKKTVNRKPALTRKITVNNPGYTHNIWEIFIGEIQFFKDNRWHDNGNLFIVIHIDEGLLNVNNVSELIINSITFRDLSNIDTPLTFNVDGLTVQIPNTWLYTCRRIVPDSWINRNVFKTIVEQIKCVVDTESNSFFNRPAQYFLIKYFPTDKKIYPFIEKGYLKNMLTSQVEISGRIGKLFEGTVDPEKFSELSSTYGKNDKIKILEIDTPQGFYEFGGVTTSQSLNQSYDQILSTFKFKE